MTTETTATVTETKTRNQAKADRETARNIQTHAGTIFAGMEGIAWPIITDAAKRYGSPLLESKDKQVRTKVGLSIVAHVPQIIRDIETTIADAAREAGDAATDTTGERAWQLLAARKVVETAGGTVAERWSRPVWKYVRETYGTQNNMGGALRIIELVRDHLANLPLIPSVMNATVAVLACKQTVRLKGGTTTAQQLAVDLLVGPETKKQMIQRHHEAIARDPLASKGLAAARKADMTAATTK